MVQASSLSNIGQDLLAFIDPCGVPESSGATRIESFRLFIKHARLPEDRKGVGLPSLGCTKGTLEDSLLARSSKATVLVRYKDPFTVAAVGWRDCRAGRACIYNEWPRPRACRLSHDFVHFL